MPAPAIFVPLVAFALLALALALFMRRVGAAAGDLRADFEFRHAIAGIAKRGDAVLGDLLPVVDEVRRSRTEGDPIVPILEATTARLAEAVDAAHALAATGGQVAVRRALVEDLERAQRAIELVQHGCTVQIRAGDPRGEAQVSVKRGYLNLLHAREAIRAHAVEQPPLRDSRLLSLLRRRAD